MTCPPTEEMKFVTQKQCAAFHYAQVAAAVILILTLIGWVFAGYAAQIEIDRMQDKKASVNSERISRVETDREWVQNELQTINKKLDILLEERRHRNAD